MTYTPVVGLEVHIQAKTKSKMFCGCSTNYFGDQPNTHVCPVCLGLPGALPVPNLEAIKQCIRLSLALGCQISEESKFDRKNYFYPDLPKGYQISQYDQPVGHDGVLVVNGREIRIRRVHQEEDTGKSIHEANRTLLDFNKSGMPLIEVVTEPDFQTLEDVTAFSKLLRQTVIYTGVSDAEMQKGQMRFELNISLRTEADGDNLPNYRVEVKNIGSISVLEKVMQFEIARQTQLLESGQTLRNETRGLRDMTGETVPQRSKETEDDYRYFPEPDIPPFHFSAEFVNEIKASLPELPAARKVRYMELGLDEQPAETLVDQQEKADWLDKLIAEHPDQAKAAAKLLIGEIAYQLESNNQTLAEAPITQADVVYLITKQQNGSLTSTIVKQVIEMIFTRRESAEQIVTAEKLEATQDAGQLEQWVDKAIADNPKVIESLAKNPNAAKALIGVVMRESRGQANPQQIEAILQKKLNLT